MNLLQSFIKVYLSYFGKKTNPLKAEQWDKRLFLMDAQKVIMIDKEAGTITFMRYKNE